MSRATGSEPTHLWLVYAAAYLVFPLMYGPGDRGWWWHGLGFAAFLALYGYGHSLQDRRRLWIVVGLCALGALTTPHNGGALVFFVYAAAFVGGVTRRPEAWWWIAGVVAAAVASVVSAWSNVWPLAGGVVLFTVLIGYVNVRSAEADRLEAAMRLAKEDVARLAVREERHRIASDLHDVLGHSLSVIALKADLAARLCERDAAAARVEMLEVARVAREALATTRSVVTGIQTLHLDEELLRTRAVLGSAGIEVSLDADAARVPDEVGHVLSLVLREAVTNIVRHSRSSEARIQLGRSHDRIELRIWSNGATSGLTEGNGIAGMRARVQAAGGECSVRAHDGVHVEAWVPMPEGART
jgi:two-component system sensor histidine kinase DesK